MTHIPTHWPPVRIPDTHAEDAREEFFHWSRVVLLDKIRSKQMRSFLQATTPQDHTVFFDDAHTDEPADPKLLEEILDPSEYLTPYHLRETAEEIKGLRLTTEMRLRLALHPPIEEGGGKLESHGIFTVSPKTVRKILRSIPHDLRVKVAHMLSMDHIRCDEDLEVLYIRETGDESDTYPEESERERNEEALVTAGGWSEADDHEVPLQSRYEYAVLRRMFDNFIHNKL